MPSRSSSSITRLARPLRPDCPKPGQVERARPVHVGVRKHCTHTPGLDSASVPRRIIASRAPAHSRRWHTADPPDDATPARSPDAVPLERPRCPLLHVTRGRVAQYGAPGGYGAAGGDPGRGDSTRAAAGRQRDGTALGGRRGGAPRTLGGRHRVGSGGAGDAMGSRPRVGARHRPRGGGGAPGAGAPADGARWRRGAERPPLAGGRAGGGRAPGGRGAAGAGGRGRRADARGRRSRLTDAPRVVVLLGDDATADHPTPTGSPGRGAWVPCTAGGSDNPPLFPTVGGIMLGGERCGVEIPWVEARPAEERVDWVGDIRATAIARQGRTLGTPVRTCRWTWRC